ncbi:MAG: 50S ribosomal protein L11 methyltransferase [Planctomycetota bacterium]
MTASSWRAFALRGRDAGQALDWLHVHATLCGVQESEHELVVWSAQELPTLPATLQVSIEERPVAPEDFTHTGRESDRAFYVAEDLLVRPPWVDAPAGFAGLELVVPRGAAFGTGEHDSTQAALLVLHDVWHDCQRSGRPMPTSAADVGAGSGILLHYLALRGVADLEACDIDSPSVAAARELLPERAYVVVGGPDRLRGSDLVVANMTGTELLASLAAIVDVWSRCGPLVLSGMREHEVEPVRSALDERLAAAALASPLPPPPEGAPAKRHGQRVCGAFTALWLS